MNTRILIACASAFGSTGELAAITGWLARITPATNRLDRNKVRAWAKAVFATELAAEKR